MRKLTELQVRKAAMLKAYRMAIRLKHSLRADAEIAETLPAVEERIDQALAMGEPLELNPGQAFDAETA